MSTPDKTMNALQSAPQTKDLKTLIEKSAKELGRALPEHMRPERVVRIALTLIRQNPDLAKCSSDSFLGALFTSAQLGVEPIAGFAYILPFNNSRKKSDGSWHTIKEAQFVLGYKGVKDLFYRHEKAINLEWGVVKENDRFSFALGTDSYLHHQHAPANFKKAFAQGESIVGRGATLGYWVMAKLVNGGKPFHYMTREDCLDHGMKHSKTFDKKSGQFYDSSPWVKDEEAMCLKTVLIQLMKILPISIELQRAINQDEVARDFQKTDDILDIPDQTVWGDIGKEVKAATDEKIKSENV